MSSKPRHKDYLKHLLIMLSEWQVKLEQATQPNEVHTALNKMEYYYQMIAYTHFNMPIDDELKGYCYFFGDTSEDNLDRAVALLQAKRKKLETNLKANLDNLIKEIFAKGSLSHEDLLQVGIGMQPYNRFIMENFFALRASQEMLVQALYQANQDRAFTSAISVLMGCRQFGKREQKMLENVVIAQVPFLEEYLIYFESYDMLQRVLDYKKSIGIEYVSISTHFMPNIEAYKN